ncbi:MaoC/PaaZ C-terminal domain-containing protein [uncultured Roseibium sp.]|uniref:MaoC/PaaZ C-terminal domain-containing protein n=1 Tax=uncultured Roseibium sp. TaxID=1936171 RepID=UPI003217419F
MTTTLSAVEESWVPTQQDFDDFAWLSGDDNPIHVDPVFSASTRFGRTVSHGMLLYSRVYGLLRKHWPGATHELQSLMFPNPSYAGEELLFRLTPVADEPNRITVEVCRKTDGLVTLSGECLISGDVQ